MMCGRDPQCYEYADSDAQKQTCAARRCKASAHGFWGPVDALHTFCEVSYGTTAYVPRQPPLPSGHVLEGLKAIESKQVGRRAQPCDAVRIHFG